MVVGPARAADDQLRTWIQDLTHLQGEEVVPPWPDAQLAHTLLSVALEALSRHVPQPLTGAMDSLPHRRLIDRLPKGCVTTTPTGVVVRANRVAERYLACYSLVGSPLLIFIAECDRATVLRDWISLLQSQDSSRKEWVVSLQPLVYHPTPVRLVLEVERVTDRALSSLVWIFEPACS